nr:MAG TPA: hypothetical protein [Caudoviricetes sp.]
MINAYEAKRKTIINCKCKDVMNEIEKSIEEAIKAGFYDASISLDESDKKLINALREELTNLGYKVDYYPAAPLPPGCPADQWDFHSHLRISWNLEKGKGK